MPSQRYVTTSRADLDYVASRRHEVEDRPTTLRKLKERKIANTKTAIAFGTHKLDYSTESSSCREHVTTSPLSPPVTAKDVKKTLTKRNVHLGSTQNKIDYTPSSLLQDPTGRVPNYRGALHPDVENAIKKSSIPFGGDDEGMIYESVTASSFFATAKRERDDVARDFSNLRQTAARLKHQHTRERNVSFPSSRTAAYVDETRVGGDGEDADVEEDDDWKTCHQIGFKEYSVGQIRRARGRLSDETMKDLKGCHFDLGCADEDDGINEEEGRPRTHSAAVHNLENLKGWEWQQERIKSDKLKEALKKTYFVLGPDPDYM
mmetsp:Transcript_33689/g.41290  ORF Transcript_33689/g.41290 Transcript_33689/m.41290 type:complete len:319 (-) Transcript_33689:101-1057(-)|eukprot:CAMPEP_0172503748 /NCGR_PEP_ID=MMETSP1066-20121228/172005_1 /TAXON_ID=671091 /ORGANISM="Coscinodiscus wailesii, Strain CCMP2513" /LENGTH=318 /DNA_ID=CAMNT_0013279609 /DNA_START=186 /DNA_END=1145 /DNA_ORIENTATION=+